MPSPHATVKLSDGASITLDGHAAEMVVAIAQHAAEINRFPAVCVEIHAVPGSVKVKLRADLEGPRAGGARRT